MFRPNIIKIYRNSIFVKKICHKMLFYSKNKKAVSSKQKAVFKENKKPPPERQGLQPKKGSVRITNYVY